MGEIVAEVINAGKEYKSGDTVITALYPASLVLRKGELVLFIGPSGSGKTTLLSLFGCIIYPTSGQVIVGTQNTTQLNESELSLIRLNQIGFVFQNYNLIAPLTAIENVMMPLELSNVKRTDARKRAHEALRLVKMENRQNHLPKALSGGEQQRVAIARALINNPPLILCDEPTASLDPVSIELVMAELKRLSRQDRCLVIVTHDNRLKPFADRIVYIDNGKVSESPFI